MSRENYHPLPQPDEVSSRDREDGMGAYLMMFASLGIGLPLPIINLIAAIIYYYVNRKKSRFVHFHTFQSLVSQLPTSILNAISVFWTFSLIFRQEDVFIEETSDFVELFPNMYVGYLIMVVIANLIYIIFSIIAASRAYKGRFYYMIFFGRIAYNYVYKVKAGDDAESKGSINLPPR
jgi:uncharacterized membrane protein